MKRTIPTILCLFISMFFAAMHTFAHFQCLIPSDDVVMAEDNREVSIELVFMHPFEGNYMEMKKPVVFGVRTRGRTEELDSTLKMREREGFSTWQTTYRFERPGDYLFYLEPAPYFEPAEQSFIIHYTKTVVHALGLEGGWDEELGLKTEIVPLTRPYGLWTGNLFRGIVKAFGKPVPFAEVEVEYYAKGEMPTPETPFITQVIRADQDGVFAYACPKSGWWAFAALGTDKVKLRHTDGKKYPVEIGAVFWVRVHDMP